MQIEKKLTQLDDEALVNLLVPKPEDSELVIPLSVPQVGGRDDPDEIFLNAVAEIDTQPLVKKTTLTLRWQDVFQTLLCVSMIAGSIIGMVWQLINYPRTIVTILPVTHAVTLTTALDVPLRALAPVTLTRSATAPATGHGHQDALCATGTLTFYNGKLSPQTVPKGTVFVGNDGQKVTTDATVTIPAGSPPSYGTASIVSHTLSVGRVTNIAADDINVAVSSDLLVKNAQAFTGGRDTRDYRAVARSDLDTLTSAVQKTLSQEMPQSFILRPGEALHTTTCTTKITADSALGNEAQTVTVKTVKTCAAVAYSQDELTKQATTAFTTAARPARGYQLLGRIQTSITGVRPFQVKVTGMWVYTITPTYEQYLAERIAGETPQQARTYLLETGVIAQATIPNTLPQAMYIKFLVLVEM